MIRVYFKTDCPTCAIVVPALASLQEYAGVEVRGVSQDDEQATERFLEAVGASIAYELDYDLTRSYRAGFDAVPSSFVGSEADPIVGWDRDLIAERLASTGLLTEQQLRGLWGDLPALRPGCASKHLDPELADQVRVRVEGETLAARRIVVPTADDAFEIYSDAGWTDGLPIVPPTPARVLRFLDETPLEPGHELGPAPPSDAKVTVEKAAINAVMAGCAPWMFPVVLAAIVAACQDRFNWRGLMATTHSVSPVLVVNGPVRDRNRVNSSVNALGQGVRANSSIGRAVQLVGLNVGGCRPGGVDRSTLGQPGKVGLCFAENEEVSPWVPLHVERGHSKAADAVTLYAGEAPRMIRDRQSRSAESLVWTFARALESVAHPKTRYAGATAESEPNFGAMFVVSPDHAEVFASAGWSKAETRQRILMEARADRSAVVSDEVCAEGMPPTAFLGGVMAAVDKLPPDGSQGPWLVVAGGPGYFSALLGGWMLPPFGSELTTAGVPEG